MKNKRNKKIFYSELAYIIGLAILALGTAFMECTDFGVSIVVAPAYLLHLKISEFLPFFSFGMAEYTVQALLVLLTIIVVRRFKISYFFSFVTAVLYGFALDGFMVLVAFLPCDTMVLRIAFYIIGTLLCTAGVSLLFHTYISPEAYELFVKEVSAKFHIDINKFKTCYDCSSFLLSIVLSFVFFGFGHFEGVKMGTVIGALLNGFLISRFTKIFESFWEFKDGMKFRKFFD